MSEAETFTFEFIKIVTVTIDKSLEYLIEDEDFQRYYYRFNSLEEIAHHIAWNRGVMGFGHVEGLLPEEQSKYSFEAEWDGD
jgi:hypothetical protein